MMVFKQREYFGEPDDVALNPMARLETEVSAALAASGKVDAADVEVTVLSGATVILSGWVTEEEEIRRCLEITTNVPGVQIAQSRISLRSSGSRADRNL